jgi:hypothetical protein
MTAASARLMRVFECILWLLLDKKSSVGISLFREAFSGLVQHRAKD